jgi:hypothetical protein
MIFIFSESKLHCYVFLVIIFETVGPSEHYIVISLIKVKLSLCLTKHHAMKAYWESGGIAPHIPPRSFLQGVVKAAGA